MAMQNSFEEIHLQKIIYLHDILGGSKLHEATREADIIHYPATGIIIQFATTTNY